MVSATSGAGIPGASSILLDTKTPSVTDDSFAEQLAAALEKYLGNLQGGSKLEIDVEPTSSQNSGGGQFLVTVKSAAPAVTPTATPPVSVTPAPPAPVAPVAPPAATDEVDAYWATQPTEVQALRNIPDDGERMSVAKDLAAKGFAIDVPIMVWGWDPLTTMMIRQNYGYTWVPSATQANIVAGPGISFPGYADYDSKNPPAGSIKVTTDFAKGLESTSPWYSSFAG